MRATRASAFLFTCVLAVFGAEARGQNPFGPALLTTQDLPQWVAIGDVVGDAHPDIVCTNGITFSTGTLSIFPSLGGGRFGPALVLTAPAFQDYVDVELADIDLDGDLDILGASETTLGLHRNLGGGNFAGVLSFTAGIYGGGLSVGDLDGNGWPDVVVTSGGAASAVKLFLNNGSGGLLPAQTITLGADMPQGIALADVDRDGDLDVLVANRNAFSVGLLRNSGAAQFAPAEHFATTSYNERLVVGDWNQDSFPDLALVGIADEVLVLQNNGHGQFPASVQVAQTASTPQEVAAGDLDGDGWPDLVVTCFSGELRVIRGAGGGAFAAPVAGYAGGRTGVALGDLDGDGRLDAAFPRESDDRLAVFLGDGTAGFGRKRIEMGSLLRRTACVDLNGDGRRDLLGVRSPSGSVSVSLALAAGGYAPAVDFTSLPNPEQLQVAFVDADPYPDLLVSSGTALVALFSDGSGGLSAPVQCFQQQGLTSLCAGDVTGDGIADVAYSFAFIGLGGYLFQGTVLRAGDGFGSFGPVLASASTYAVLAVGDINGDQRADVFRSNNGSLSVWLSNGSGGVSQTTLPAAQFVDMLVLDVDQDGDADLLGTGSSGTWQLSGDGTGSLGAPTAILPAGQDLESGDFDGDGDRDLLLSADYSVRCYAANGALWTDLGSVAAGGSSVRGMALSDADKDGRPDLILGGDSAVVVVHNRGPVGGPVTYCTAKLTSNGCLPAIGSSGTPSASATSGFVIDCHDAINQKAGLLLHSQSGRAALPFQGGTLCLAGPYLRGPVVFSGGNPQPAHDCSGVFALDFNAFAHGFAGGHPAAGLTLVGSSVTAQWWGRDPLSPLPGLSQLSNALDFVVGP